MKVTLMMTVIPVQAVMATNHVIPMNRKTISLNQMQNLDWESLLQIGVHVVAARS